MATDSQASMFHTLRILRPSLFADWPAFLAAGVIAVAAFAGVAEWVRSQAPAVDVEGVRDGLASVSVLGFFLISLFSRSESHFGEGKTHPISRRRIVLLHILDNLAVCLVWLLPPVVAILLTLGVERTHWELLLRIALLSRVAHALLVLFYLMVQPYSKQFAMLAWTGLSFFALALVSPYVFHWYEQLPGLTLSNGYVSALALALYWLALSVCDFGAIRQTEGPAVCARESLVRDTDWSVLAGPRRSRAALLWEKYRLAFGLLAISVMLSLAWGVSTNLIILSFSDDPVNITDSMDNALYFVTLVSRLRLLSLLVFFMVFTSLYSLAFLVTTNQLLPAKGKDSILLVMVALTMLLIAFPGPAVYFTNDWLRSILLRFVPFAPLGCLVVPLYMRPKFILRKDSQLNLLEGILVVLLFVWILVGFLLANMIGKQPFGAVIAMALTSAVVSYALGVWAYNRG